MRDAFFRSPSKPKFFKLAAIDTSLGLSQEAANEKFRTKEALTFNFFKSTGLHQKYALLRFKFHRTEVRRTRKLVILALPQTILAQSCNEKRTIQTMKNSFGR